VIDAKTKGLANVLVVVEVPGAKIEKPTTPFVLDQRACVVRAALPIVPAGRTVVLKNSDPVAHNVHVYSAPTTASTTRSLRVRRPEVSFARPDKIKIGCDYHPWMTACCRLRQRCAVIETTWRDETASGWARTLRAVRKTVARSSFREVVVKTTGGARRRTACCSSTVGVEPILILVGRGERPLRSAHPERSCCSKLVARGIHVHVVRDGSLF